MSVLSPENHEYTLIDMSRFKNIKQAAANQIICEDTRANLERIEQVVAGPANVEQAVAGLVKFEPAAAGPEVNCLVALLCALFLIPL